MKILIADDDADFRDFLEELLNERGLVVTVAVDGEQAIVALESDPPDILFLDLSMPVVNGIGVLKHLAELSRQPQVVVCSGDIQSYGARYGDLLANTLILRKPFELQQLDEVLNKLGIY